MRKNAYNGKTHLLVAYQWDNAESDAVIVDKDFETANAAWMYMAKVMPASMTPDDGYKLDEWPGLIENGAADIFDQYNAQLDESTNVLAVLRPVMEGGEQ